MSFVLEFRGICTHFQFPGDTPPVHRVVLVKWDGGTLDGQSIPQHFPLLTLPAGVAVPDSLSDLLEPYDSALYGPSYWMKGVRLITGGEGAAPGGPPAQPTYLPSLTQLADEPNLAFSTAVVSGPEAACHFNLSNGTLLIPPDPPPPNPVVFAVPASSIGVARIDAPDDVVHWITGLDDMAISVSNECAAKPDCPQSGFLLHYLTCGLLSPGIRTEQLEVILGTGPSCSNAQFP